MAIKFAPSDNKPVRPKHARGRTIPIVLPPMPASEPQTVSFVPVGEPLYVDVSISEPRHKRDRKDYQREYMRKRRAKPAPSEAS